MFEVNTPLNLENLKKSNLFSDGFVKILSDDLSFMLDDFNTLDISNLCSLIAISPTCDIKEIIIKDVDILKHCKVINICLFPNNIAKATLIINNTSYWVSIYFHMFINSHLTSWIHKTKLLQNRYF